VGRLAGTGINAAERQIRRQIAADNDRDAHTLGPVWMLMLMLMLMRVRVRSPS
jgi:hypothetical protein